MSWQKSPLTSSTSAARPPLRVSGLPAEKLGREGVHTSRGLPGPHGPEDRHAGIQAALGNDEPGGIEDFPALHRVMFLPDHDPRPLVAGIERPHGKLAERGKAAVPSLEPDPPDRQQDQADHEDQDGGRQVVPKDHPAVKTRSVVGHQIEQRIFFEQGKGPVEEAPGGPSQAQEKQDRMTPFHGASLRRDQRRHLWSFPSLPAGIIEDGSDPSGGRISGVVHRAAMGAAQTSLFR